MKKSIIVVFERKVYNRKGHPMLMDEWHNELVTLDTQKASIEDAYEVAVANGADPMRNIIYKNVF